MNTDVIVLKQLPIIEGQLQQVKARVDSRVEEALSLVCTEETRADVKKTRTELRREFEEFEQRRKEIKAAIFQPYDEFDRRYQECVGNAYKRADAELKRKIDEVEDGIRDAKHAELEAFYDEKKASLNIPEDLASLADSGVRVTLSASVPSLKKQAATFLNRVAGEIAYIQSLEHADEIMVEFRRTLNAVQAAQTVEQRHKQLEAEKQRKAQEAAARAARQAAEQAVEQIAQEEEAAQEPLLPPQVMMTDEAETPEEQSAVPAEEPTAEKKFSASFRVTGTLAQLRKLKEFLENGGYDYESI